MIFKQGWIVISEIIKTRFMSSVENMYLTMDHPALDQGLYDLAQDYFRIGNRIILKLEESAILHPDISVSVIFPLF